MYAMRRLPSLHCRYDRRWRTHHISTFSISPVAFRFLDAELLRAIRLPCQDSDAPESRIGMKGLDKLQICYSCRDREGRTWLIWDNSMPFTAVETAGWDS
eukprot:TRINITY_DN25252_c0_g1_i1.p1 TRINITY_DN25252_c0_g1~~TRINITY_DN25252_c0_g1_i1.p1  ORF type:complete len:100 (-),score=1.41 TRINITY_DN25252_c0_g1_i1:54-353(-)